MSQIFADTGSSPAADVETLTGNDFVVVGPDGAFNINVIGLPGSNITTTGNAGNNTIFIDEINPSALTFTTDDSNIVSPDAAGNLNVLAALSSDFDIQEIQTVGDVGTNTVTVTQFNTITGFISALGPTTVNVITFDLGGTAAVYIMDISMVVADTAAAEGAGYNIFGTIRTTGAAASLVGTPDKIVNEEGALAVPLAADANMIATGNNFQLTYLVPLGSNVNITAYVKYTKQVLL